MLKLIATCCISHKPQLYPAFSKYSNLSSQFFCRRHTKREPQ